MHKIAIIDDDPDIVEANRILLEANGFDVVSAASADDGNALIMAEQPDLIILDVMMLEPDDGFFLALNLRRSGVTTPIIMLTSVSKAVGYHYVANDMVPIDEFLEKPVPPAILLNKIKTLLGKVLRGAHAGH